MNEQLFLPFVCLFSCFSGIAVLVGIAAFVSALRPGRHNTMGACPESSMAGRDIYGASTGDYT